VAINHPISHSPLAITISHQPFRGAPQNFSAARNTTVRGGRIAVGDMNCVSVLRCPVDGSRNDVDGSERACHTQLALVRLLKSIDASSDRDPANVNSLPTRRSIRFWKSSRRLPSGSRLIVWLPPIASARLIWRVIGRAADAAVVAADDQLLPRQDVHPGQLEHSVRLIDELLKNGKGDLVSFMTLPG
jgi:hypothetical protein